MGLCVRRPYPEMRTLHQIAEEALAQYDLRPVKVALVSKRYNTVYRVFTTSVQSSSVAETDRQYILRISALGERSEPQLFSEVRWLDHLRTKTSLVAPRAVPTRKGDFIASVPSEQQISYLAVLFERLPGRFLKGPMSLSAVEKIGAYLGRLHTASDTFSAPQEFDRPCWDGLGLFISPPGIEASTGLSRFSRGDRHFLTTTISKISDEIANLDRNSHSFGLIHFDFKPDNYLFHRGEVGAIDFDLCGYGFFMFDIAVSLLSLCDNHPASAAADAFLAGYKRVRFIPASYRDNIYLFTTAKLLARVLWAAGRYGKNSPASTETALAERMNWLKKHLQECG